MSRINILLAIVCALFVVGVVGYKEYPESNKLNFVIEMESSVAGTSQIFIDTGHGYNETDSIAWHVQPGVSQKYSFPLPALPVKSIRFDPINLTSVVSIKNAGIENALGETIKSFPPQSFTPKGQIRSVNISGNVLTMQAEDNANDPKTEIENSSVDGKNNWVNFLAKRGWIYAGYALFGTIIFMGLFIKCPWQRIAVTLYQRQNVVLLIFCSLLIGGLAGYKNYLEVNKLYFAIEMESSVAGTSQLFFNTGHGYNEGDSSAWHIQPGSMKKYLFPLPALSINSMRFDPINLTSVVSIKNAGIENALGETIKKFPPQSFVSKGQISKMDVGADRLTIYTDENADDPKTEIENSSVDLKISKVSYLATRGWIYAVYALLGFIFFMGLSKCRFQKIAGALDRLVGYSVTNPKKMIAFVGFIAAVASCYPVVFLGMSYLSPLGAAALYSGPPWIPGFPMDLISENFRGSDVGAMAWSMAPNSAVQHDSIFHYFEFPFWSRYVGGGGPLFAQGQSMMGDVLHWIPVLLDGSAIGWDIKFVLSKAIFAIGMGLLVFRLTEKLLAGVLIAISSCFLGFFAYRFNHPAIFVLTYAPWVVLQWDRLGTVLALPSPRVRSCVSQGLLLAAVTWLQLNAGSSKEGVITLCFMQALGMLAFWGRTSDKWGRIRSLVFSCGIAFALVMITAPHWLLFLDALSKSFTAYDIPGIGNFAPWALLGFFDNYFFQRHINGVFAPSVNLFVLFGVISALLSLRFRQSSMTYGSWGLFVLAMFTAYGLIPESFLIAIPFINKIQHVGNTFSVSMMVLALIIAGYGISDYLDASLKFKKMLLVFSLASFIGLWFVFIYKVGDGEKPILFVMVIAFLTLIVLAQLYRQAESGVWERGALIILIGCFLVLHVRHGMHLTTGIGSLDAYVLNPTERGDFSNKSSAIEFVKSNNEKAGTPTRVIGEGLVLFPGFNSRYGTEGLVSVEALRNKNYNNLINLVDYPEYQGWGWLHIINSAQIASHAASLDLLGVGYIVAEVGTPMPQGMKLVHSSDLDVWQRESVWPRAFFVNKIIEVHKPSDIVDALADKSHTPFAAVESQFIPEGVGVLNNDAPYQVVPAGEYRLTNNSTHFFVEASEPGIIVLGETYYPGDFVANVNGEKVDYIRVNEASKGIWVNKAGKYDVSFTYRPERLNQAMFLCLFGLVLLLVLIGTSAGVLKRFRKEFIGEISNYLGK